MGWGERAENSKLKAEITSTAKLVSPGVPTITGIIPFSAKRAASSPKWRAGQRLVCQIEPGASTANLSFSISNPLCTQISLATIFSDSEKPIPKSRYIQITLHYMCIAKSSSCAPTHQPTAFA